MIHHLLTRRAVLAIVLTITALLVVVSVRAGAPGVAAGEARHTVHPAG